MILNSKPSIKTYSLILLLSSFFVTSAVYAKQVKILYKIDDGKMTISCSSSDIEQSSLPSICKENTEETSTEEPIVATDPYQEAPAATIPSPDKNTLVFDTTQFIDTSSMNNKELIAMLGKGGNKSIYLSDGDDYIDGSKRISAIYAGDGDYISAGNKDNIINAGNGNDTILASTGKDVIYAGSGSNIIDGGDKQRKQEIDTLVYAKPREAYDIQLLGSDTSKGDYCR
jgi:hypothetical protein